MPIIVREVESSPFRRDSPDEISDALDKIVLMPDGDLQARLKSIGRYIDGINSKEFSEVMHSVIGVDVSGSVPNYRQLMDMWTNTNAGLIKKLEAEHLSTVATLSRDAVMSGSSVKTLAEQIAAKCKTTMSHAMLIAVDQTGKLNGNLTEQRQTSCGIEEYIWETAHDSRVRPEHRARNNHVFKWSDPAWDGPPGQAIRCRCVALPIIDTDSDFLYKGIIPQQTLAAKSARQSAAAFRDAPKEMLKKPHGSGIIANIKIPQSLGARATPITVKTDIPVKTDIVAEFREWHVKEGAEITDVELIASGRQIREVEGLISKFRLANGDATKVGGWRKMKGFTILTDGKTDREAEVHWYQCHGVGRVKWKEKLD